jgi:hypothetical protein
VPNCAFALLRELLPDIRSLSKTVTLLDEGGATEPVFTAERAGRVQALFGDLGRAASPGLQDELNALSAKAGL